MTDIISPLINSLSTEASVIDFYYNHSEKIKKLSGYQSGKHFLPKYYSKALEEFVRNIAKNEIEDSMREISDKLRTLLGLGVNDFQFDVNAADGGIFECKGLTFHMQCKADPENLQVATFTYQLTMSLAELRGAQDIFQAFPFQYTYASLSLPANIDLKDFIDQLEVHSAENPSDVVFYYDPSIQFLEITGQSSGKHIVIHSDHFDIYFSDTYTVLDFLKKWQ